MDDATPWTEIEARVRAHGQEHLLAHDEALDAVSRSAFRQELAAIDWSLLPRLISTLRAEAPEAGGRLEPAPSIRRGQDPTSDEAARARGEALLRDGRVGVFVVAGGQGSRLGFDGPKGVYPATPVRRKPLFQVFAEKIRALGDRYGRVPTWYVMTSRANDRATREHFDENGNYGLASDNLRFCVQDMLPAVDDDGRIVLSDRGRVFLSPNGHGGSLLALRQSGALDEMRTAGIDEIFYFQVDNPLVDIADPVFLGYHRESAAEMSSKVVSKRDPDEKVGVVGLVDGRYGVIEYSDLSAADRHARDGDGRLRFDAGNIAVHAIRRDFVERVTGDGLDLPYHVARKSMRGFDVAGGAHHDVNGVKFETFVFDALSFCENSVVLSVDRATEFAPIKNAEGDDSPITSRAAQVAMHADWLRQAGIDVPCDASGVPAVDIEIAPEVAREAADLESVDLRTLEFEPDGLYLDRESIS